MNVLDFHQKKKKGEKITWITCYDYTSACIINATDIDCVLVGDTVAMTLYGHPDTIAATLPMVCAHTRAVSRGIQNKFIIGDLPFLTYRKSLSKSVTAVQSLIQSGAHAVKLEGGKGNIELIQHLVESGIPVVGHIGLTPQFFHALGGYKVQGKTKESAKYLQEEARLLQDAGCFALVLECVPVQLAKTITQALSIPTIGIGAGPFTDGQVLVLHDLLGLYPNFKPKFVKTFMNGYELLKKSIGQYVMEVKTGQFPDQEHCYEDHHKD